MGMNAPINLSNMCNMMLLDGYKNGFKSEKFLQHFI